MVARLLAALLSVGCLLLSLVLASKIAFEGFAMGGWTGLKGYEQAIVNARHMAYVSMPSGRVAIDRWHHGVPGFQEARISGRGDPRRAVTSDK